MSIVDKYIVHFCVSCIIGFAATSLVWYWAGTEWYIILFMAAPSILINGLITALYISWRLK